jgi:hypothetical protein
MVLLAFELLNRRSKSGRPPFHRRRLSDDLIDVIAVHASKRTHLESDQGGLDVYQTHFAQAFGVDMEIDRDAVWIKRDCDDGTMITCRLCGDPATCRTANLLC